MIQPCLKTMPWIIVTILFPFLCGYLLFGWILDLIYPVTLKIRERFSEKARNSTRALLRRSRIVGYRLVETGPTNKTARSNLSLLEALGASLRRARPARSHLPFRLPSPSEEVLLEFECGSTRPIKIGGVALLTGARSVEIDGVECIAIKLPKLQGLPNAV